MIRTFFAVTAALCLTGCAVSSTTPAGAGKGAFLLALDKNLVGASNLPITGGVAARERQTCRWVELAWTRIRKKVCEPDLSREHLRNASQAGLRALRRSEASLGAPAGH